MNVSAATNRMSDPSLANDPGQLRRRLGPRNPRVNGTVRRQLVTVAPEASGMSQAERLCDG